MIRPLPLSTRTKNTRMVNFRCGTVEELKKVALNNVLCSHILFIIIRIEVVKLNPKRMFMMMCDSTGVYCRKIAVAVIASKLSHGQLMSPESSSKEEFSIQG